MPKHEPTDSYFYLATKLAKCMVITDALNLYVYPARPKMTTTKHILASHVFFLIRSELKEFLFNETLSYIYYMDKNKSKDIIVNKRSTGEDES